MNKTLSGHWAKEKSSCVILKVFMVIYGSGCLQQLFITNFKSQEIQILIEDMIVAVVIENNFGTSRVLKLMASALALQCSTNWAMKTHTSGADHWIKFAIP